MHAGFLLACGVVANRCHTQTITATSSTEAEFLAAVEAAKIAKYLRFILRELGFSQDGPTPIYEDNESAIKMINAGRPTVRSRHIDIQHFAIQDWKQAGDIRLLHVRHHQYRRLPHQARRLDPTPSPRSPLDGSLRSRLSCLDVTAKSHFSSLNKQIVPMPASKD
jgi:hypothetical protein